MRAAAGGALLLAVHCAASGDQVPVTTGAVITSSATLRRVFGAPVPAAYQAAVPAVRGLLDWYLARSQTLDFVDTGALSAAALAAHKVVLLPGTAGVGGPQQQALLSYADAGGLVLACGAGLLYDEQLHRDDRFGAFGAALNVSFASEVATPGAVAATRADSATVPDAVMLSALPGEFTSESLVVTAPGAGAEVLASAKLPSGASAPLVVARRRGAGWLVYTATCAPSVAATGVGFMLTAASITIVRGGAQQNAPMMLHNLPAPAAALLARVPGSASAPERHTVSVLSATAAAAGGMFCVEFIDNWHGDSAPGRHLAAAHPALNVTVQKAYSGALACATVRGPLPAPSDPPVWFTVAGEPRNGRCATAADCELNGHCGSDGACVCDPGWEGPSCGTLRLLPAPTRGAWPMHRPLPRAERAPGLAAPLQDVAIAWGGTVVQHAATRKWHGFFNTGCYDPVEIMHVTGFQIAHGVGDAPSGPFQLADVVAPPTHFNPKVRHFTDSRWPDTGVYVLYVNGNLWQQQQQQRLGDDRPRCNGAESPGNHSAAPYTPPKGNCTDPKGVCALYSTSPAGPWSIKSVSVPCNNNVVPLQLRNGTVVLAGQCTRAKPGEWANPLPGADVEQIIFAVADRWDGPFSPVGPDEGVAWNVYEPGEDPTLWQDKRGAIHILFHGYQWQGLWPGMHAYSLDGSAGSWGLSRRLDGRGAFSTEVSWADGSPSTRFFRRERPELILDSEGNPDTLLTGIEYGYGFPGEQYSFTIAQRVNTTASAPRRL
eukprot:TRINITY_DN13925_c0_g1_i1.p1 TRINITY_DN13925_c0_g1~~TRINITY_DN13925_c0_g1_i1.p1  ORF type:complete len:800 (+),score=200.38 TRINITY_DN13925_c0_g1_i1:86-2401(+)